MNAPARFPRPILDEPSPLERAHRAAISVHCVNQDEMAMAARVDIAIMRDSASVGVQRAGDAAATILAEVARMAAEVVYAPLPTSKLLKMRSALSLTMEAARAIERVQRDG